ncbi:MAG TPA: hypothetical protein VF068_12675 [Rubrobacter sp.]
MVGGMSRRAPASLAWSLCALSLVLTALSLLLLNRNLAHPNTYLYDYWLDNTLGSLCYAPVGALIAARRPANPVGWLLCMWGVALSIGHFSSQYAIYALLAQPRSLPAGGAMAWISSWILPVIIGVQVFSYLLFPTGRLPSTRWKWFAWLTVAFLVAGLITSAFSFEANTGLGPIPNPLGIDGFSDAYDMVLNMLPILYGAVAFSLFVRMRRAAGVERQQIKWFAYAAAATIVGLACAYMIPDTIATPHWFDRAGFALNIATTPAIPLSMGIAILRYRLYDIDVIINRTLVYGSLTVVLALLYFGGVTATQALFQTLTGHQKLPQIAIVVSTLVIAALFNPVRRRIQSVIDRRFYRRKYDASKTLEIFSSKLRDKTDLKALNDDLVGVVRETMQPANVALWLRSDALVKSKGR